MGAAISLITATQTKKIDSLIAVSSPSSFWRIDYQFWRMGIKENIIYNFLGEGRIGKSIRPGWLFYRKTKPSEVIDKITIPMMFIHGQKDWLIRPWHSKKLFDQSKTKIKRLELIPQGTHAEYIFRNDKEGTIKLFKEWFRETL